MRSAISTIFIGVALVLSYAITAAFGHNTALEARANPNTSQLQDLLAGNQRFRNYINFLHPGLFKHLSTGQHPGVLYLGCVDSRVSEGTVFDALPGTIFATRNIANQFHSDDISALSTLAYGVNHLDSVQHILVMGHYGCGGVSAAITSANQTTVTSDVLPRAAPPDAQETPGDAAIDQWIEPITQIYLTSNRSEIVALRKENAGKSPIPAPALTNPGFRALVEENVKASVANIVADPTISTRENQDLAIYVHGWVYDIANGKITDLKVDVGPL